MSRYFAHVDGEVHGPALPQELKDLLGPEVYVCAESGSDWVLASSISELAPFIPKKFYALVAGNTAGPYSLDELGAIVQPELMICAAGSPDWVRAADHPDFAPRWKKTLEPATSVSADPPPANLPPKLQELWRISRNAENDLLLEQKKHHWKKFFKEEKAIITEEISRRGLK